MPIALLAFGSNVGDSPKLYREVQTILADRTPQVELIRASQGLQTQPIGKDDSDESNQHGPLNENEYLNAALLIRTELSPQQLIAEQLKIETQLGRVRDRRWGPRTVDLDLLLYDDLVIQQDSLICPHPRMSFRRFVLEPAAEVAAEMVHPDSQLTIAELLDRLNDRPNLIIWLGDSDNVQIRKVASQQTPLRQTLNVILPDDWPRCQQDLKSERDSRDNLSPFWICQVADVKQFASIQAETKLLIVPTNRKVPESLALCGASFRGARLVVDPSDPNLEKELYGAIDAMI